MAKASVLFRAVSVGLLAGCVVLPAATGVFGQNAGTPRKLNVVRPSDADAAASQDADVVFRKAWSGTRPRTLPESKLTIRGTAVSKQATSRETEGRGGDFVRVPGHLTFNGGNGAPDFVVATERVWGWDALVWG